MGIRLKGSRQSHGFSLIEMAIVLVIVMTVLTLGLGALSSVLTSSAYSETKARQARIKDALIAYVGSNKRLPCPNIPNTTAGVTGIEDRPSGACANTFGVIPFATLGLSRDVAEDGWGGLISYRVYVEANGLCPGTRIDWSDPTCFGTGKTGGIYIQIMDGPASSPTILASGVVAVLISHGPNGLRAWVRQGTRNADPLTCEEAHNSLFFAFSGCNVTARFFKGERSGNDDVVAYLTADDIIQALAKQGAVLSATARVSEDLRMISYQKMDEKVSGGCSSNVSATSVPALDPWGTAYVITNDATDISRFPITICSGTTCRAITKANFNSVMTPTCP